MGNFTHYSEHVGASAERWFKRTIFQSQHMLVGLDCLEPGQAQAPHLHHGHDKCYFVVEGEAEFTVGDETRRLGPGGLAWAPADIAHSVTNLGAGRLVMLISMAPEPR